MSALRASGSSPNGNGNLRVAVPNKGTLSEPAAEILSEAGYRRRTDPKDLTVIDPVNNVEFFFLRPKDIAIYVGSGQLDFGITGRDLAQESDAPVRERLALGFGSSSFRYAAPAGRPWHVEDLAGKRIATAFPNLVRKDLARRGIDATVVTPGLESPTIAPLADPAWVAVRALVPRRDVNAIMDELAAIGAKAILASDIRFCRF